MGAIQNQRRRICPDLSLDLSLDLVLTSRSGRVAGYGETLGAAFAVAPLGRYFALLAGMTEHSDAPLTNDCEAYFALLFEGLPVDEEPPSG